jgi:XTP/dITP diphosphohydrolase
LELISLAAGQLKVTSADDVKNNWEKIKLKEKDRKSVLSGVPNSLPAIVKAFRMQEKVSGVGFDWENAEQVWGKVKEEMEELQNEVRKRDSAKIEMELGDLLFSLVNYSRLIGINPEDALERTNKKFIKRFKYIEEQAKKKGKSLQGMSLPEMDTFWEEAKKTEKQE